MAKNFNVEVQFKASGHKGLEDAINSLIKAQRNLRNGQVQYNRVLTKSNAAIATLEKRNKKLTQSIIQTNRAFEVNEKTGGVVVKNNRLLSNTFATLRSKILLVSFAFGLFSSTIGRLIRQQAEQELSEKRLEAALGKRSQTLLDQASALQQVTGFGDEAILSAQSLLAAFIKDEEQLALATQATLDLAAAKGMDLTAAADLVGKSIGSSTNALSRYGINVEGSAGSTKRLETAVRNISRLFGGQAVAQTQTISGQIKIFENNAGDLAEKIGKDLADSFVPMLRSLNEFIIDIQNGEATIAGLEISINRLADALRLAATAATFAINPFKKLQQSFVIIRAAVTTGRIGLANYTAGLVGLGQGAQEADLGLTNFNTTTEKTTNTLPLLMRLTDEQIQLNEQMRGITQKRIDAETKLKNIQSEDMFILTQAMKIRDMFNKQFGTTVQLNKEFLETLDPATFQLTALDSAQQQYAMTLLQLFDALVAVNEEQNKLSKTKQQIAAIGQLGQALQVFAGENKQLTILAIRLQQIAAVADAYSAFNDYLAKGKPLLASAALATGLANAMQIEQQLSKARAAATGADFVTQGRQLLMVGDNATGRERVQVTPLGSSGGGGGGDSSVTINLNGNILGTDEFVRDTLIPQIENAVGRNLA